MITDTHFLSMKRKNNKMNQGALEVVNALREKGHLAFFAGGCVRDFILGVDSKDMDIATSALPSEILNIFPKCRKIGESFGIINVVNNNIDYEVATFREEDSYRDGRHPERINYTKTPRVDAARRDFTINAMFYDPFSEMILDYFDGIKDLEKGCLRTVGNPTRRFNEDYLRILRAVRFAIRFELDIQSDTYLAIKNSVRGLHKLSSERIRDELNKILTGKNPSAAIDLLFSLNILNEILPELSNMAGVEQSQEYHPEGDVFVHTKLMLRHMVFPTVELAWSVLLHDTGKVETFHLDENNIPHFYNHETLSAEIGDKILTRLKFSNNQKKTICTAVRNHMKFAHVNKMRRSKLLRMISEDSFSLQLELHRLDCISSHKILDNYNFLLDELYLMNNTPSLPPPLVTGKDLIDLGWTPGPEFGKVLKHIRDMQLEKIFISKDDAVLYIKNYPKQSISIFQ